MRNNINGWLSGWSFLGGVTMLNEVWKDVLGYEGLYEVSNLGKVKSIKNNKILADRKDNHGYFQVQLYKKGVGKSHKVHRLVLNSFSENKLKNLQVNHIDENKTNNNISNLEWVTPKENSNHGTRTARSAEKHKIEIVAKTQSGIFYPSKSGKDLSKKLGVHPSNIFHVLSGKQKSVKGLKIFHNTLKILEAGS